MDNTMLKLFLRTSYNATVIVLKDASNNVLYKSVILREASKQLRNGLYNKLIKTIKEYNATSISVKFRGYNKRPIHKIIEVIKSEGINITWIRDETPIPHNGCIKTIRRITNLIKKQEGEM